METNYCIPFFTILIQLMSTVNSQLNCPATDPAINYRPVIGIVSHPGDGASGRLNSSSDVSYIAASYVKFAEMGGARVIPIIYTDPPEIINQKLNLVNGIIFTGGRTKKGPYFEVVKGIFEKVLEKNDAGEHFPLLAICLGFELITMIISKDNNILEEFSASHQASTVQFVENIKLEGTVFGRFPPALLEKMTTHCLVMQNHRFGISPEGLQANKDLCSFFRILTTSVDKENKVYVSSMQAQRYPVTALQWHPEKAVFEWGSSQIPHTEDAIQVTQNVANYFVSEARKSLNKPATNKLLDNLIYNYSPSYAGKVRGSFEEVYLFTPHPTLSSL
ncbi:gamma-glutamyl hydrolase 2 [Capsicum chacoense]